MAGRRHHYLPRLLQRPFAHRQSGKEFYVYAHHRTRAPYATNVMNLGQERDFYGDPSDTSLDDAITRSEDQLGKTINKLNAGETVTPEDIASLIAALSFRTKAMRRALTDLIPPFVEAGRTYLLEGRQLQDRLHHSLTDPKARKKLIYEQIREKWGNQSREQQAKLYALMLPKWKVLVQENESRLLAQARDMVEVGLKSLMDKASEVGDGAFLKALAKGPDMPERTKRLATEMVFEVWEAPVGEHFLLGDCGTVGLFTDGKPRLPLGAMDDDVNLEVIFLPISPTRCVVARKPTASRSIDLAELNRLSASFSHEFFVSRQKEGLHLDELRGLIGTADPIASRDEIAAMLTRD